MKWGQTKCLRVVWLALVLLLVSSSSPARADFKTDLGFGWTAITPDGYSIVLDAPKGTAVFEPFGGVQAVPIALIAPNWNTLGPVAIRFVPTVAGTAPTNDRFMFRMTVANDTGLTWQGFDMRIVDDNNVRYPNLTNNDDGTILHPNRAHFHVDELLNPSALGFSDNTMTRSFYDRNGQFQTTTQALDNSSQLGQFDVHQFSGPPGFFTVPDQQTWKPLFYDLQNPNDMSKQNYLELHVRPITTIPDRAFTVFLQPDVVPEPSSLLLLSVAAVTLTGCAWCRSRRSGLSARRPG